MKKIILASSLLFGMGCGGGSTVPIATDCSELVVLSEEEISVNAGVLPAESCWLVDANFTLSRALSVKEGVVIEFAQGVQFVVTKDGSLTVEGTEAKPVLFTGSEETAGFWKGIEFVSDNSANKLDHAIVEYAGSNGFSGADFSKGAIYLSDAQLSISNSVLRKNGGGAFVFLGDSTVTLETNEISENEVAGRISANLIGQIADSNTWDANTDPSVNVIDSAVSTDQTWLDLGTSLNLNEGLTVNSNLVLSPNLNLLFAQEVGITVKDDGSFNAVGTAETPISFSGTDETQGFWKGIYFESKNSANIFDFVSITHAGSSRWNGAADSTGAIFMDSESKLVVTNTEISMSGGFALIASKDGDISGFATNKINDNAQALNLEAAQVGGLNGDSTYENNMEPFISVSFGTIELATLWKKQTTPFRIIETVNISADLQIDPGAVFEFGEKGLIAVLEGGSMNAEGTATDKIIFTGADEISGFWKGISFDSNSPQNILKHVEISYGGSERWNGAADSDGSLYITGRIDISDSKVGNGGGFGIVNYGEVAGCSNVDLSGNAKGEVNVLDGTSACP